MKIEVNTKPNRSWRTVLTYTALCVVATLFALPLIACLLTSLQPLERVYDANAPLLPSQPRWTNYVEVFRTLPFARFMVNSTLISTTAAFGAVLTSSMAGYALANLNLPYRRLWFTALIATLILPSQILFIPQFMLFDALGWIGTYKPLIVPAWLGGGAFNIFLFRQFFKSIPKPLAEAAELDGASPWQCYRYVMMPTARPVVVTAASLSFMLHWRFFFGPLMYLSDFNTFPVSLGLRMYQTLAGTWINLLMAATVISTIPLLAIFLMGQRFFPDAVSPNSDAD